MNLGFTIPWLLAGIPAALTFLVIAYRRSAYGNRVIVPTLFLLKHLQGQPTARRKFVPPLRFFFELLLLTLVALAAAGTYLTSSRRNIALVIDNSLSMGAKDWGQTGSPNILAAALEGARDDLARLSGVARVKVYETSPRLRAISQEFESPGEAGTLLSLVRLRFAGDNLEAALSNLLGDAAIDEIYVFSDKSSVTAGTRLSFRPLSVTDRNQQNVAISRLSFSADSTLRSGGAEARVEVSAYTNEDTTVDLRMSGFSLKDKAWRQIAVKTVSVPKRAHVQVPFEVEARPFDAFMAELVDRGAASQSRLNSIPEDDRAFVTVRDQHRSLLLVSDYSLQALGLRDIGSLAVRAESPQSYTPEHLKGESVIFHRFVPPELPKANSLFVLPPPANTLFPVSGSVTRGEVTRWLSEHPILSYLNLPTLELQQLFPLLRVPWMSEIVQTTAGTAALAGERGDYRYVVTGFELFPYEGRRAPFLSIFLLNILKWLSDSSVQSGHIPVYSAIELPDAQAGAHYVDADHADAIAIEEFHGQRSAFPMVPGLVLAGSRGEESLYAADFFESSESNLLDRPEVHISSAPVQLAQRNAHRDLLGWLCLAAAFLIGLDLLIILLRSGRALRA